MIKRTGSVSWYKRIKAIGCWLLRPRVLKIWSLGVAALFALALASYNKHDISVVHYARHGVVTNLCAAFGAQAAAISFYLFGISAWFFVLFLLYLGLYAQRDVMVYRPLGFAVLPWISALLCACHRLEWYHETIAGGLVGAVGLRLMVYGFDHFGALVAIHALAIALLWLIAPYRMFMLMRFTFVCLRRLCSRTTAIFVYRIAYTLCSFTIRNLQKSGAFLLYMLAGSSKILGDQATILSFERIDQEDILDQLLVGGAVQAGDKKQVSVQKTSRAVALDESQEHQPKGEPSTQQQYLLPKASLFTVTKKIIDESTRHELKDRAQVLEQKLERFGVHGRVTAIKEGPVVTLYEYEPQADTKLSKIIALEDDLAMALQAMSIRIIAPIPGRSVVGFEVANKHRSDVSFASSVRSALFQETTQALPLILGQDTVGNQVIIDLARTPHLLVAGSTGSGKSVALNAMLVSLLCKKNPDDLKLILIDPKRLEFAPYADIPHLLFPIIADPRKAAPVLKWVVRAMEERYDEMAQRGVRNIADYNAVQQQRNEPKMPYIVVVIDELADLMMTAGRDVEDLIARIAQMARAAGIHLLLATQRPSVDVITGLIKVNFPSRVSFRVTSKVDSRTILDACGAEKLLGRGDMLFLDGASASLRRVHGAYVSDSEIAMIVEHVKAQRAVQYLDIQKELCDDVQQDGVVDDVLYHDVVAFVRDIDEVSISLLQRKFRIGFNRSARLIDLLESKGLIMPSENGKTRKVIR